MHPWKTFSDPYTIKSMAQTTSPTGPNLGQFPLPPENDSSAESIRYQASSLNPQAELYNSGVVPELTLGSPKKNTQISSQLPPVNASGPSVPQPPPAMTAYQQPQTPQPSSALPSPIPPAHLILPKVITSPVNEYWQTVIVPPAQPTPNPPPVPAQINPPQATSVIEKLTPTRINVPDEIKYRSIPTVNQNQKTVKKEVREPIINSAKVIEEEEVRSATVTVLASGYIMIGVGYFLMSLLGVFLVYWLNLASAGAITLPLPNLFIRSEPIVTLLPITLGLASLGFMIVGIKLKSGTRSSWGWALITGICFPLLILLTSNYSLSPVGQFLSNPQLAAFFSGIDGFDIRNIFPIFTVQLVSLFLPGLLLVFGNQFHYLKPKNPHLNHWWLWGWTILVLLPLIGYLGYSLFMTLDKDLHYKASSQTAGFHVYRPLQFPSGWEQVSYYSINQSPSSLLVGRDDFIEVVFDRNLTNRINGSPTAQVIIREVDVPASFNLTTFTQGVVEGARVQETKVQRALGQKGYLIDKSGGNNAIRALALITSDNVLLLLSTKEASETELINIANSMD
jgi:hypothetical protein